MCIRDSPSTGRPRTRLRVGGTERNGHVHPYLHDAARNTGTIAVCTVLPRGVVQVRVELPVALGTAHAEARAGPASARESPVSPGE